MKNDKLEYLSAYELGELVNKKEIKVIEVVDYFIDRINRLNPKINAFTYLNIEYARNEAKKMDERIAKGEYIGPFAGVPFALKDFLPSKKGWPTSLGGVKSLISIDTEDSEFTKAMEKLGGIAIGKCNAPSFGFKGLTDNKLYGATLNPFNVKYNAGGSSGGSAASVASGLVLIAEGGDAGGSIRVPASWNNLVGYKASMGMIPNISRPDAWAASHPYCTSGGLTKSVKDTAILLNEMIKYDPRDPLSIPKNDINYVKELDNIDISKIKIAYTDDFDLFEVTDDVKNKIHQEVNMIKERGIKIDNVHFHFKHTLEDITTTWCRAISVDTAIEFALKEKEGFYLDDIKDELPQEFIDINKMLKKDSNILTYYHFNVVRTEIYDELERVLKDYDYIISPTTLIKPVLNDKDDLKGPEYINGKKSNPLIGFAVTFLTNFTGHPSVSLPSGLLDDNLPIGLHIIGHRFKDEKLLALIKQIENITPWDRYYKLSM